jgi:hypothetical protein
MKGRISLFEVPIRVITPDGKGTAVAWVDYGKDSLWIISFPPKIGECLIYANAEIKVEEGTPDLPGRLREVIRNTCQSIYQSVAICPGYRQALQWFVCHQLSTLS